MKYGVCVYSLAVLILGSTKQLSAQPLTREFVTPVRIAWATREAGAIDNVEQLLKRGNGQATTGRNELCVMTSTSDVHPGILLDFGKEINGGLQIVTGFAHGRVRIRFGESAGEAMSEIGQKNSTNDHAIRDEVVLLPMLGRQEIGNTGFRFARVDFVDDNAILDLKEVRAVLNYRNLRYLGSFHCSDSVLDQIWRTGAYTVQLNMQDYLWDGIKRDRLVWMGDMHPEVATIEAAFGYNALVPQSLDFVRDNTPLPKYMNSTISYSMWWILIQKDWYWHYGNLKYLREQASYLKALLRQLCNQVNGQGEEILDGGYRFLDWPTHDDTSAIHAGLQGLLVLALQAGADLCKVLKDDVTARLCSRTVDVLRRYQADPGNTKQVPAMLSLAGLAPVQSMDSLIVKDGVKKFSTFFGFYMLEAMAKAGDYETGLNDIRKFWGGMLKMGATTFWEDFDVSWMEGASAITALPDSTQKDIHGDYGGFCYVGYRKSLCHGWASGPTAWLTEHVLGVSVVEPGCKILRITPHLADLQYAEGSFATPFGIVSIRHTRKADGSITSVIHAPVGVKILR